MLMKTLGDTPYIHRECMSYIDRVLYTIAEPDRWDGASCIGDLPATRHEVSVHLERIILGTNGLKPL